MIDLVKFGQGNRFPLELLDKEFSEFHLTERYFETIEAPCKRLVWLEQSAHNPPFEEPDRFNQVLIEQVLLLVRGRVTCSNPTPKSGNDAGISIYDITIAILENFREDQAAATEFTHNE